MVSALCAGFDAGNRGWSIVAVGPRRSCSVKSGHGEPGFEERRYKEPSFKEPDFKEPGFEEPGCKDPVRKLGPDVLLAGSSALSRRARFEHHSSF